MDEFVVSFINEAQELIAQLEKDLLNLEKQPEDKELINSAFRVMHTIKGTAGMFGFENIQNLTHEFENLFDKVRKDELKITSGLIDITLKCIDIIQSLLNNENAEDELTLVFQRLKSEFSIIEGGGMENYATGKSNGTKNRMSNYCILFKPDAGIFERGIDPENTIEELKETGPCKVCIHENGLAWVDQKREKKCTAIWEIYLSSNLETTDIENVFMFFDKEEFAISPLINGSIPENSEFVLQFINKYKDYEDIKGHITYIFQELATDIGTKHPLSNPTKFKEIETLSDDTEKQSQQKLSHVDTDSTINVSSLKIDELLNLVSELVTSTAGLQNHAERLKDAQLFDTIENLEKLTKQFRNNALNLRLTPVGTLLNKFKRQVRDLSKELKKEVNLIIEGQDTEIDKAILKAIESPLMHIIRNSIDHGLEYSEERVAVGKDKLGLLKIIAFYSGANVVIQVQDDGRGINLERVKECAIQKGYIQKDDKLSDQELLTLIMEPGFTTTENITVVSGRGVGMDVVKRELSKVSGSMEIDTEKGLGTYITLKLPTTLSIIDTLILQIENSVYLIPLLEVEYCFQEKSSVLFDQSNSCLRYKDEMVPFISLREKFHFDERRNENEMVVIINKVHQRYALVVDKIVGQQQTVIKNLGELFIKQPYFSGGNIMVDGRLALILDTNYLFNKNVLA
jgi:two-component system chemotaxis sensor kinase CheA